MDPLCNVIYLTRYTLGCLLYVPSVLFDQDAMDMLKVIGCIHKMKTPSGMATASLETKYLLVHAYLRCNPTAVTYRAVNFLQGALPCICNA